MKEQIHPRNLIQRNAQEIQRLLKRANLTANQAVRLERSLASEESYQQTKAGH